MSCISAAHLLPERRALWWVAVCVVDALLDVADPEELKQARRLWNKIDVHLRELTRGAQPEKRSAASRADSMPRGRIAAAHAAHPGHQAALWARRAHGKRLAAGRGADAAAGARRSARESAQAQEILAPVPGRRSDRAQDLRRARRHVCRQRRRRSRARTSGQLLETFAKVAERMPRPASRRQRRLVRRDGSGIPPRRRRPANLRSAAGGSR